MNYTIYIYITIPLYIHNIYISVFYSCILYILYILNNELSYIYIHVFIYVYRYTAIRCPLGQHNLILCIFYKVSMLYCIVVVTMLYFYIVIIMSSVSVYILQVVGNVIVLYHIHIYTYIHTSLFHIHINYLIVFVI